MSFRDKYLLPTILSIIVATIATLVLYYYWSIGGSSQDSTRDLISISPATSSIPGLDDETIYLLEAMYLALGSELRVASLCEKISPKNYLRQDSECFFEVAVQANNANLCTRVLSLQEGTKARITENFQYESREECLEVTSGKKQASYVGGQAQIYYQKAQMVILEKMGYDQATINEVADPINPTFLDFIKTDDFQSKLTLLPDLSQR